MKKSGGRVIIADTPTDMLFQLGCTKIHFLVNAAADTLFERAKTILIKKAALTIGSETSTLRALGVS